MATVEELSKAKLLQVVKGVLGPRQLAERYIYLRPEAADWMRSTLRGLEVDGYVDDAISPNQQAYQLFKDFISGEDMFSLEMHPKPLRPQDSEHGIWELRTPDLRFFGWFCRKGVFLVSNIETKSTLLADRSYGRMRDFAVEYRNGLDLDEPKVLMGGQEDVF